MFSKSIFCSFLLPYVSKILNFAGYFRCNDLPVRYTISQQNSNDYVTSTLTVISVKDDDAGLLTCRAVNQKVATYTAQLEITFLVGT